MSCKICNKRTSEIINFGDYPVSHKFKKIRSLDKKFNLTLCICKSCKIIQLKKPFPLKELKPKFDWINYNEPEEHLDKLVNKLNKLKNINKDNIIAGAGYKELSILNRFKKLGFKNTWVLNSKKDLKIKDKNHNLETIQDRISKISKRKLIIKKKPADIFIARHILEHTYSTIDFINSLQSMINDNGYLVVEVPDCENSLKNSDYAMLWEEHLFYFTETSLKKLFLENGYEIKYFERYRYSYENVLIIILKKKTNYKLKSIKIKKPLINFSFKKLKKDQTLIYNKIKKIIYKGYKVCLFGTGHVACTFIKMLELSDLIDLVVDDNKKKFGMYLPNLNCKIKKSKELKKYNKLLIILGVNSESEKKIIKELIKINSSIKFCSVYNNSDYSFRNL